jgi:alanine-glyoxylate transaminase/serine-glyoxylate transaminase/serine-pyruvate transaminase
MGAKSGRHFLQIPGPTNVPDRVLRAISLPTMDHRGPEFGRLGRQVLEGLQKIFQTKGGSGGLPVVGDRGLGGVAGEHLVSR